MPPSSAEDRPGGIRLCEWGLPPTSLGGLTGGQHSHRVRFGWDDRGKDAEGAGKAHLWLVCRDLCRRLADDLGNDRVLHLIEYLSDGVHALRDLP